MFKRACELLSRARVYIITAAFAVVLYELLENLPGVAAWCAGIAAALAPLIFGLLLAYIMNIPAMFFERTIYKRAKKYGKTLSAITAFVAVTGVAAAILALLLPVVIDGVTNLIKQLPDYLAAVSERFDGMLGENEKYGLLRELSKKLIDGVSSVAGSLSKQVLPVLLNLAVGIASGVFGAFTAFIVSLFALTSKKQLSHVTGSVINALFHKKADNVKEFFRRSHRIIKSYLVGQSLNALILALAMYVIMMIFAMPYSELISVMLGASALIPVIGPVIGTAVGGFLVLLVDSSKLLWFLIASIAVQQIEGNLIYPRIVGDAVGLSGFFVIASVLFFGGLFGFIGMLVGVPITAIIYALASEKAHEKRALKVK